MAAARRWLVSPEADFRWRGWEGRYVVFHCQSGDTHQLNALAASALRSLQEQPASAPELARRVATKTGIEPDEELLGKLEGLLREFDDAGLIEPADDPEPAAP
jgi:PqqD family protein of HPr-rel-A system